MGGGHISKVLENNGYKVFSSDLIKRNYEKQEKILDFLQYQKQNLDVDIITNPPYKFAREFVEKSLEVIKPGRKVAMFLKLTFLESENRKKMFEKYPPKKIYVFSKRINCAKNGDEKEFLISSAVCYAWFIWEKGSLTLPVIDWI